MRVNFPGTAPWHRFVMERMITPFRNFHRDERGATSIEYCLIASIVSIAAVAVWTMMGINVNALFAGLIPGLS